MKIKILSWVSIVNYKNMTNLKISVFVGNKFCQYEWMKEKVSEFYEAIYLQDKEEIFDEAIGLIRTYQHFHRSKPVIATHVIK